MSISKNERKIISINIMKRHMLMCIFHVGGKGKIIR
jgi:hypothetical protein